LVAILTLIILKWTIRRLLLYKIFLYDNKDIFVTKQSPDLGFTDLVQHKIILRPDAFVHVVLPLSDTMSIFSTVFGTVPN
jgi:hypothetical protein